MILHSASKPPKPPFPELWGGFECTVNRIGNAYMDQLELSGHAVRESDLELLHELGVRAVRYPILWERHSAATIDWKWADRRLFKLRELGIRPLVGLLHHGSGPLNTNLLDPEFPKLFAAFAQAVAERYPWIDAYTPVNEPLTTARFSCLYGHWYPHLRDDKNFMQALMNETRASIMAMREIRKINPAAQFIQTEDLGKVHSTSELAYQAEFENERRWLSIDLLCGKVGPHHPIRGRSWARAISEKDYDWFSENPCAPDMMGMNYYLSSERFLDHRVELYPACPIGGNGRDAYVDVEAVRILKDGISGAEGLLKEAWERFSLPLALTELHNGCTREEQARWFVEQYYSAASLVSKGIDVRAVTAWALLGSFNWNTLVTREGTYEPGVYDLRAPQPRPTVMVNILKNLAEGKAPDYAFLHSPGWWRRPTRHSYGVCYPARRATFRSSAAQESIEGGRPILIAGRSGTLGRAFAKICDERGLEYELLSRPQMDIANLQSVTAAVERYRPWAIVNAAGYVRVDDAELENKKCSRENALGPAILAAACETRDVRLVTFSSDLVFDGSKRSPYLESDAVCPLNVYGQSKADAESAVLSLSPSALIIRTSGFFGPWDSHNFVTITLKALSSGRPLNIPSDEVVSPTYVPDLVHASLDLLIDGAIGIWHLASQGSVSWAELALKVGRMANVSTASLSYSRNCRGTFSAPRPRYSVLGSERASLMPSLEDALARYLSHPDLLWRKTRPSLDAEEGADLAA
jgi:dTDP-4-dehydrorhamnose reductase